MDSLTPSELEKMAWQELAENLRMSRDTLVEISQLLHDKLFELKSHETLIAEDVAKKVLQEVR